MSTVLGRDRPYMHVLRPSMTDIGLTSAERGFSVSWAVSEDDVRAAQALRFLVFATEFEGGLHGGTCDSDKRDIDRFDFFCDHLLVRALPKPGETEGLLVGTYRVLSPEAALRAGGLYADSEFDLDPLRLLRPTAVELGRSCVRPGWRSGGVVLALWAALCDYMVKSGLDTMIGCASVSMADGGHLASEIWHRLQSTYLVDQRWQVKPHRPLPLITESLAFEKITTRPFPAGTPPLIKGYLRCGARLLGPPAMDPVFNTADLPIMLRLDQLNARYRKHFFRPG